MLRAVKPAVPVLWLLLAVGGHVFATERPICEGGDSVLGARQWNDTLLCCTREGKCLSNQIEASLENKLQSELKFTKPLLQRSSNLGLLKEGTGIQRGEASCCSSKVSVLYPLSGLLALTGERVSILQLGPFRQPVAYELCEAKPCRYLRGNCTQVYTPLPLYVLADNGRDAKLDYVLVESGCRCNRPDGEDRYSDKMGVDRSVKEALRYITGRDLSSDQLIGGQEMGVESNSSNLNTASVLGSSLGPGTTQSVTAEPSVTQPEVDSKTTKVDTTITTLPSTFITTTTSAPTTIKKLTTVKTTRTTARKTTFKTMKSTTTTQTAPTSTEMLTPGTSSTVTVESTTSQPATKATTVLPLPSLPPPGQPIEIKPGFFNPVAILIRPLMSDPKVKVPA